MATWPTCGQSGYIIPAVLEVPNAQCGDQNHKWPRGLYMGKVGTSPLPSWGSPNLSAEAKIGNGYPTCGQSGYIAPIVFRVPNAHCGAKSQKWLCGPHVVKMATSPLPS